FLSSRRRHTRSKRDWSSDVCSSDLEVLNIIEKEKISCVYLVPTIIHDLLTCNIDNYDLSSLKKIGYAGAAMTKQLTEEVYKRLKPEIFVNHYGSTDVYTYSIFNYMNAKN